LNVHSDEELKMLVAASAKQGVLQESERVIVGNALDFADTVVRQVMIPRTEIVALPEDSDLAGVIAVARQARFSRFPVYRDDIDLGDARRIQEEGPGTYVIDGLVSLADLREKLGLVLEDEPYDTVGGLVFGRLGRLAEVGDAVDVEGYRLQVTGVDGRRVSQVRAQRIKPRRVAMVW